MNAGNMAKGRAIIVVGMHRSGTSALTRVLNLLGVELGDRLLPPGKGNRHGHWEHLDVVRVHETLLHELRTSWDDTGAMPDGWMTSGAARHAREELVSLLQRDFSGVPLWAVKDPRICRLLPLWKAVLDDMHIQAGALFVVRHPLEVADSLHARDKLDRASTRLGWFEHMAEAERATRCWHRGVVVYDDLLSDWRKAVGGMQAHLQLRWPNAMATVAGDIDAFLDKGERHSHVGKNAGEAGDPSVRLHECLVACAHDTHAWGPVSRLVDDYHQWSPMFLGDINARREHFRNLLAQREQATAESDKRAETIRAQERRLYDLLETMHGMDLQARERDAAIDAKDEAIRERDVAIGAKDEAIRERDAVIEAKTDALRERDLAISAKDEAIRERDAVIDAKVDALRERDAIIGARDQSIGERDQAMRAWEERVGTLVDALDGSEKRNVALVENAMEASRRMEDLQARLWLVEHSRSWRLTAPLRATRRATQAGLRMVKGNIRGLAHSGRRIHLMRGLGLAGAFAAAWQFLRRGRPGQVADATITPVFDVRTPRSAPVGILTTQHCLFVAKLIADALGRLGIPSEIQFERPTGGFTDGVPYFVICPQMFDELPGLYVSFQMEQSVSSRWFTEQYLRTLEHSYAIFDYSIANIKKLTGMGLSPRQFFYLPIGPLVDHDRGPEARDHHEYDVIFYGDANNARRRAFLEALEKVCRVKVVGNLFGTALHEEVCKAKVVVNIHYYEDALLETTRLWECLSLGKLVVSERSSDMDEHEDLAGLVDFTETGDVDGMVDRVRYWIDSGNELENRVRDNDEVIRGMTSHFDYFFYRFMLYSGNMDFREFWDMVGEKLPAPNDKLCLNLPEYVDRAEAFDSSNHYGFTRFAGLKHPLGWVGCAMSYKFMAMWANKYHLPQLVVCEDDVDFPDGFDAKWRNVARQLQQTHDEWDLFSGILADLHKGTKILDHYEKDGNAYVMLDRMISAVFNVYNQRALALLADWDGDDFEVEFNTIDRYLEQYTDLRVMTTLPFLVGHKEHLYSTLWGIQNTQYTGLIEASQKLLGEKVKQWRLHHAAKEGSAGSPGNRSGSYWWPRVHYAPKQAADAKEKVH